MQTTPAAATIGGLGEGKGTQLFSNPFRIGAAIRFRKAREHCRRALPLGSEGIAELLHHRSRIAVRILFLLRHARQFHHHIVELRPADHDGMFLRSSLEGPAEVVDEDADRG